MLARLAGGASIERANVELATLAGVVSAGSRRAWAEDVQSTEVRGVRAQTDQLFGNVAAIGQQSGLLRQALRVDRGAVQPSAFSLDLLMPEIQPLLAEAPAWFAYCPEEAELLEVGAVSRRAV